MRRDLRKRAESLYAKRPASKWKGGKESSARLLHELTVHQIELEMQDEELKGASEKLLKVSAMYQHLFDYAPVGYLLLDKVNVIHKANFAAANLLGGERADLQRRLLTRFVASCDKAKIHELVQKNRETAVIKLEEVEMVRLDRSKFYAELIAYHDETSKGDISETLLSILDITKRKKAEMVLLDAHAAAKKMAEEKVAELVRTEAKLKEAERLADIGRLSAAVAHELRSPLAEIRLFAHSTKERAGDLWISGQMDKIDSKVEEGDKIIKNMLFYSRLRECNLNDTNIARLIHECELSSKNRFPNVKIHEDLSKVSRLMIRVDEMLITELFTNLIWNACEAVADSEGSVEIYGTSSESHIIVGISDDGPGISHANMDKIFEPFFTTKPKGTGLGLFICRQIVKLHGGTLKIVPSPVKGKIVTVQLPI